MRAPVNRAARVQIQSIPPSVGGLNTLDAVANMPPTDAIILDNYFPSTADVPLRNGYQNWGSGIAGNVETLAVYSSGTEEKLFAIYGGALYDVSANAAVGAPLISGLTNSRWQWVDFTNAGKTFLVMVNGVDAPLIYDGTDWHTVRTATAKTITSITASGTTATLITAAPHGLTTGDQITITGATPDAFNGTFTVTVVDATTFTYTMATAPGGNATVVGTYIVMWSITGTDPTQFVHVQVFASRLWFTQNISMQSWYLPVGQVAGAAVLFDVGPQTVLGGFLMGIATWNIDNSAGLNPYIIFVTSKGEAVVYQGSDPSQATSFSISARFRIGAPVGRRFFEKYGSDIVFIGADGLTPLSKALLTDRAQRDITLTEKISPSVNVDVATYGRNFGWQVVLYPDGNKLVINVPTAEDVASYQYVMNTITKAWCRFTGWNAFCFAYFNGALYMGGKNFVAQADIGSDDGGLAINSDIKPAYNYFGQRGQEKYFRMIRPVFITSTGFQPLIDLSVDFDTILPTSAPTFSRGYVNPWDLTPWDQVPWADAQIVQTAWESIDGLGYAATFRMRAQTTGIQFSIQSVDFMFEAKQTPSF
ncbi:hypothetical protein [Paraburkholderia fynbosensis]|uniref:Ubiquitin-activating enzyme E1 FCCH domain-containing protein n=1 Tax=Paraburkholderia fynbosensis TaxID=1200993 RepID=A0A6J5FKV2_9BURK|nr:hypothetical protein [Paraburkholderia fynbosensis]CAB3782061.1 hypothetical protein LMG27177_01156 [Paraburkholderia fynbosensis]